MTPLIGITCDNKDNTAASGRYESPIAYARAVAAAGGLPVLLPHEPDHARDYAHRCDGIVLTGGGDPRMEPLGRPTHPKAQVIDQRRQAFELALLQALDDLPDTPVLGVCLGMQLMGLAAGGRLDQHLPETLGDERATVHQDDNAHDVTIEAEAAGLQSVGFPAAGYRAPVVSWHRQALCDAGRLRVLATAPDGVIEAVDDPSRRFYLGVQWHPERMDATPLGTNLYALLVAAARCAT